jgi:hypothetical protein
MTKICVGGDERRVENGRNYPPVEDCEMPGEGSQVRVRDSE